MAKEVKLYNGKGVAIVDDEDFEKVSKYSWHLHGGRYAARAYNKEAKKLFGEFANLNPV